MPLFLIQESLMSDEDNSERQLNLLKISVKIAPAIMLLMLTKAITIVSLL